MRGGLNVLFIRYITLSASIISYESEQYARRSYLKPCQTHCKMVAKTSRQRGLLSYTILSGSEAQV